MTCKSCPGPGPDCRCGRTAYGKQFRRDLRREYSRFTTRQLELPMGLMDDIFDKVEQGLGVVESLKTDNSDPEEEASEDVIDVPDDRQQDWEAAWKKPVEWGPADGASPQRWHAWKEGRNICFEPGPGKSPLRSARQGVLAPGACIPACTTCIIGASRG